MNDSTLFDKSPDAFRLKRHGEEDQEGWMVCYADMVTLLFIFFALMLSVSVVSKTKFELMSTQFNHSSASNLMEVKSRLDSEIVKQSLQGKVTTQTTDEGLQIQFNDSVLFETAQAELNDGGKQILSRFIQPLTGVEKEYHIAIEGHTDDRPIHTQEFQSNWSLSSARAVNVLHFLGANGLSEKRMMIRAYGDTRPVPLNSETNATESENKTATTENKDPKAQNRRVTLLVY